MSCRKPYINLTACGIKPKKNSKTIINPSTGRTILQSGPTAKKLKELSTIIEPLGGFKAYEQLLKNRIKNDELPIYQFMNDKGISAIRRGLRYILKFLLEELDEYDWSTHQTVRNIHEALILVFEDLLDDHQEKLLTKYMPVDWNIVFAQLFNVNSISDRLAELNLSNNRANPIFRDCPPPRKQLFPNFKGVNCTYAK